MKALPDPNMGSEALAREVFVRSRVHTHVLARVWATTAEGGVTSKHLIEWARDNSAARSLLDNIDFSKYLVSLLDREAQLWTDLVDIQAAIELKDLRGVHENSARAEIRERVRRLRSADPGEFVLSEELIQQQEWEAQLTKQEQTKEQTSREFAAQNAASPPSPVWDVGPFLLSSAPCRTRCEGNL